MKGNVLPDSGDDLTQLSRAKARDARAEPLERKGLLVGVLCVDYPIGVEEQDVVGPKANALRFVSAILLEADDRSRLGANQLRGAVAGAEQRRVMTRSRAFGFPSVGIEQQAENAHEHALVVFRTDQIIHSSKDFRRR